MVCPVSRKFRRMTPFLSQKIMYIYLLRAAYWTFSLMGYLLPLRGLMFWLCLIVQTFYSPTIKVNLVESSAWIDNATCEVCSQERERRLNKPLIYYLSLPTTWWPKHLIAKLTSVEKRILYLQETYTSLVVLCCMSGHDCGGCLSA